MKTFSIALAAAFAVAGLNAAPAMAQDTATQSVGLPTPDPENLEIAQRIVDRGFPLETREDLFFGTMDQMTAQMRESSLKAYGLTDQGAIAVLDEWIADYIVESKEVLKTHIPTLMDGMAASYAVVFTTEELRDIEAFVNTSSGQRFMMQSSAVLAEPNFAQANQVYMDQVQAQLPAAIADLQQRLTDHFSERSAR